MGERPDHDWARRENIKSLNRQAEEALTRIASGMRLLEVRAKNKQQLQSYRDRHNDLARKTLQLNADSPELEWYNYVQDVTGFKDELEALLGRLSG